MTRSPLLVVLPLALAACAAPRPVPTPSAGAAETPPGRAPALVVSIDALSEHAIRQTLDRDAVPTLFGMFEEAACAAAVRPAMPSVTAAGHAAIWTGAWGDVTGISANNQPRLPRDRHTLLELESGFSAAASRGEPIWISAALAGLRAAGHHVTQAPMAPGYRPLASSAEEPHLELLRTRARTVERSERLRVMNGYNATVAPHTALTERTHQLRPARGWRNTEGIAGSSPPLLEAAFAIGRDSVYALFHGRNSGGTSRYSQVLIAVGVRDAAARGYVGLSAAPPDSAWPRRDSLARHFSAPVVIHDSAGNAYPVAFRLFHLADDAGSYVLYHPAVQDVAANHAGLGSEYLRAINGWTGNSGGGPYGSGAFGRRLDQGGDGTAELRWLETAQYMTRQAIAGAEWLWRSSTPDLFVDYFSLGDDTDHRFYGFVSRASPAWNDSISPRIQEVRRRAWALVDMRVAALDRLARERGGTLFVTGDHGMRAAWRSFRPNALLRDAGLLAADTSGKIDLSSTRAVSPNGYWISVNRSAWNGGIVPDAEAAAVIDAAERALLGARGSDGQRIVTRVFRAADHDSLGLGGPVGGDLYYETAPGYSWSSSAAGSPSASASPFANHGFPSIMPDMQTALCVIGPTFPPRRIGRARLIDIAPTVSELLGISPPATARGRSLLQDFRRAAPR
jgi:hypothetical protein